jgi:glucose/mannose-6-phosphate isomerase
MMNWSPKQLQKLDPEKMYENIVTFPEQLQKGFNIPVIGDISVLSSTETKNIVVAGMGGSAIGGDLLRTYLASELAVPMYINRNYSLPKFVDHSTLFIASSYSGNTEETLAAFDEAKKRGCKIFIVTTGGKLGAEAMSGGYPHVIVPGGLQPRAALGYSFGPLLNFLGQAGFVQNQSSLIEEACSLLMTRRKKLAINTPEHGNEAKKAATLIKNKIAIIYAGADYYDVVATRIKGQICENAKNLSFANVCPEFNHNEIVGYEFPKSLVTKLAVIFLTGPADSVGVTNRFKIIHKILTEKKVKSLFLKASGSSRLTEMLSLVQLGDYIRYYLALANKTDPTPIHVINRLKTSLEKMK